MILLSESQLIVGGFNMDKWIKVSDKLPNSGELVLAYHTYDDPFHSDQHIIISHFEHQDYWMDGTITHWMPLPAPPEI